MAEYKQPKHSLNFAVSVSNDGSFVNNDELLNEMVSWYFQIPKKEGRVPFPT